MALDVMESLLPQEVTLLHGGGGAPYWTDNLGHGYPRHPPQNHTDCRGGVDIGAAQREVLMASLSNLKLREEIGRTFSQAPAPLVAVANKRTRVLGSGDDSSRLWYRPSVLGETHARWQ